MLTLNDTAAKQLIAETPRVVVQFGAPWCGPCRTMKPLVEEISASFPNMTFAYVDIDDSPLLAKAVPTVIGFANGSPVAQVVGSSLGDVVLLAKKIEQSS